MLDGEEVEGGARALHLYHDTECPAVRALGGETLSVADRSRVAETRRRYPDDALEAWSDWG